MFFSLHRQEWLGDKADATDGVEQLGERVLGAWEVCGLAGIERRDGKHKTNANSREEVVVEYAHAAAKQVLTKNVITDIHAHKKPACEHPSHAEAKTYTKEITSVGADISCTRRHVGVDINDGVAGSKLSGKRRPNKAAKRHDLGPCKVRVDLECRSIGSRGGSFACTQAINDGGVEACSK